MGFQEVRDDGAEEDTGRIPVDLVAEVDPLPHLGHEVGVAILELVEDRLQVVIVEEPQDVLGKTVPELSEQVYAIAEMLHVVARDDGVGDHVLCQELTHVVGGAQDEGAVRDLRADTPSDVIGSQLVVVDDPNGRAHGNLPTVR